MTITAWYYKQGGEQQGPSSEEALSTLARDGTIGAATPVRSEESDTWQPYGSLGLAADTEPGGPPPLPTAFPCSRCGEDFARSALLTYRGENFCGPCKADYFQHLAQGTLTQHFVPFLFIKRAMAKAIDVNIGIMLVLGVATSLDDFDLPPALAGGLVLLGFFFYISLIVVSTKLYGGTPGKLVFRLAVVDAGGVPVGYAYALGRVMAEGVSMTCIGMGYLMALTDPERRTLHDRICQTRVVPWSEVST